MKAKNSSGLNLEELSEKEKTLKRSLGMFTGILIVLAIAVLLLFIQKQFTIATSLVAVLFALLSVLISSKKNLAEIETEKLLRKNKV